MFVPRLSEGQRQAWEKPVLYPLCAFLKDSWVWCKWHMVCPPLPTLCSAPPFNRTPLDRSRPQQRWLNGGILTFRRKWVTGGMNGGEYASCPLSIHHFTPSGRKGSQAFIYLLAEQRPTILTLSNYLSLANAVRPEPKRILKLMKDCHEVGYAAFIKQLHQAWEGKESKAINPAREEAVSRAREH